MRGSESAARIRPEEKVLNMADILDPTRDLGNEFSV
jgi:hypothetical protein